MTQSRVSHARLGAELLTIRDWLRWLNTEFARAELHFGHGTEDAWDDALALVCGALRLPFDRLETLLDARVLASEGDVLASLARRRIAERVPVPYLVGRAWLAGQEFLVDERVLIPRSPIAHLLAEGLEPWLRDGPVTRVLDLCTGSGCLGILAALAFPDAEVLLTDVSADALAVAEANISRFGLADRVRTLEADGVRGIAPDARFDLVLCNPPYVDAADLAAVPDEYRHEPELALAGGDDGLDLVSEILRGLSVHLDEEALLVLEVGNSIEALLARFPSLPFVLPELEQGGVGVVLLGARDLRNAAA